MQAVLMPAPRSATLVEIAEPQVGSEDVLIEVRYVGLCGTDLNTYRGLNPLVIYPRIPGHEVSGLIVETGAHVPASVKVGSAVMVSPYTECGLCTACQSGRPNCCQNNQTYGVQRDGVLTRRFAVHFTKVYTHPDLTLEELALVEPLSVGYHAANRGRVTETDTVLVIGCGTIGIGVIAAAARKGAVVIAVDVDRGKLGAARKYGAQYTIDSSEQSVVEAVKELTHGEGVSVAIEAVGLPETFRLAVEAAAYSGRVVYVGYTKEAVTFNTTDFVRKELDILGSRNALRVFPAVMRMLARRQVPFRDLISRVYPFPKAPDALRDWDAAPGAYTKILINLEG